MSGVVIVAVGLNVVQPLKMINEIENIFFMVCFVVLAFILVLVFFLIGSKFFGG